MWFYVPFLLDQAKLIIDVGGEPLYIPVLSGPPWGKFRINAQWKFVVVFPGPENCEILSGSLVWWFTGGHILTCTPIHARVATSSRITPE